jgi:hypothetical protein
MYSLVTTVTGVTPMMAVKSICDGCDDRDARMRRSRTALVRALCFSGAKQAMAAAYKRSVYDCGSLKPHDSESLSAASSSDLASS